MYIQLPDYDDFQCSDLPNELEVAVISKRIFAGFPIHAWLKLKRHLFNMRAPAKLFKAISGDTSNDKKDGDNQEILFLPMLENISRTSNGRAGIDLPDYGDGATFPHMQDTPPRYTIIIFYWE